MVAELLDFMPTPKYKTPQTLTGVVTLKGPTTMKLKATLFLALALTMAGTSGCISLTSWAHNKRHLKQIWNELQNLHEDIDRIIFGLERNPAE